MKSLSAAKPSSNGSEVEFIVAAGKRVQLGFTGFGVFKKKKKMVK